MADTTEITLNDATEISLDDFSAPGSTGQGSNPPAAADSSIENELMEMLGEKEPAKMDVPLDNTNATPEELPAITSAVEDIGLDSSSPKDAAISAPDAMTQSPVETDQPMPPQPPTQHVHFQDPESEEDDRPSWQRALPMDQIRNGLRVAGEFVEPVAKKAGEVVVETSHKVANSEFGQKTQAKTKEIMESEGVQNAKAKVGEFATTVRGGVKKIGEKTKPAREQAAADIALLGFTVKEKAAEAYTDAKPKMEEFGRAASQKFQIGARFLGAKLKEVKENLNKGNNQGDNPPGSNPPHVV